MKLELVETNYIAEVNLNRPKETSKLYLLAKDQMWNAEGEMQKNDAIELST